jgi:hypothetical protein
MEITRTNSPRPEATTQTRQPSQASFVPNQTCIHVWVSRSTKTNRRSNSTRRMETLVAADATDKELVEINEYDTFSDRERSSSRTRLQEDRVHLVYAVKRRTSQARLVAGGHLTETPVDSVYSSVVSLRIRITRSSPNRHDTWSTDILCLPRVIHPRESVHCCWSRIRRARRTLSSLSRRYMAYDPPDYDGHDSLTYYAIWDSSYLKETRTSGCEIAATTTST